MSCSICEGYSSDNCPCCAQDVEMVRCPDCLGDGVIYLAFDLITRKEFCVSEVEYLSLPADEDSPDALYRMECKSEIIQCPTCHGNGEIPENF